MARYRYPNHNLVRKKAREFIALMNISALPIEPLIIAQQYGIIIESYSDYEEEVPRKIALLRKAKCEAITTQDPDSGEYHILYDDKQGVDNSRIRFTISHEIGHVYLDHPNEFGKDCARRGGLLDKNHPAEKEADTFAAEILRPAILLILSDTTNVYDIQSICDISYEAANIASRQIHKVKNFIRSYQEEVNFYSAQFYDFIHQKYCQTCSYYFIDPVAKYCPICGCDTLLYGNTRIGLYDFLRTEGEIVHMKYSGYTLDQITGKALKCPRCENEEISTDYGYCKICGTYLINICAGEEDSDMRGNMYYKKDPCGTVNDGNARYCIKCGCETAFYQQKLFAPWQEEKKQIEAAQAAKKLPPPLPGLNSPPQRDWHAGSF